MKMINLQNKIIHYLIKLTIFYLKHYWTSKKYNFLLNKMNKNNNKFCKKTNLKLMKQKNIH